MRFARTLTVFGLAFVLVAGLSPSAWAQISTGGIYGKVTDEQSAVLPGATVTLTGANTGARSTTSGPGGEFRFIGLDPGTYTVAVALPGFATTQRTVTVSAGVSVDVNFTAKVAGVAETVTVDAETPVIDTKKMGTGTTVSQQELTMIPNSRDPWAFMRAVPGVQVDRVNQAGSESGQQSGFIGKGSPATDAMWVLDGIVITDPAAVGASPTYFDFDAFDEIAVTTTGADLTTQGGGASINLTTKRGTNSFHGSARYILAHDDLSFGNLPDSLANDPRLENPDGTRRDKADHIQQISDYGFDVGGPIVSTSTLFSTAWDVSALPAFAVDLRVLVDGSVSSGDDANTVLPSAVSPTLSESGSVLQAAGPRVVRNGAGVWAFTAVPLRIESAARPFGSGSAPFLVSDTPPSLRRQHKKA